MAPVSKSKKKVKAATEASVAARTKAPEEKKAAKNAAARAKRAAKKAAAAGVVTMTQCFEKVRGREPRDERGHLMCVGRVCLTCRVPIGGSSG